MKAKAFKELCIRFSIGSLPNSDTNSHADPDVSKGIIGLAYQQLVAEIYKSAVNTRDYSEFESFMKSYTITPILDKQRNDWYITLPCKLLILPNLSGVRRISPSAYDTVTRFNPIDENDKGTIEDCEIYKIDKNILYYLEGQTIRFLKFNPLFQSLFVNVLISFDEFEDDDEIGIPADHSFDILKNIVMMLTGQPQEKKTVTGESVQFNQGGKK